MLNNIFQEKEISTLFFGSFKYEWEIGMRLEKQILYKVQKNFANEISRELWIVKYEKSRSSLSAIDSLYESINILIEFW